MEELRVLLADDHAPTRDRIRDALHDGGCLVVADAATAAEAVALARQHRPDVALLDIHMPGNGIRAARDVVDALPDTVVVMLTASENPEDLVDAIRAGAAGYLLKSEDPDDLPGALRRVVAGEPAMAPALVLRIMDEFRAPGRRRFRRTSPAAARLSSREWEVMDLLAGGATTDQVARRLFLSPTTVRVHVSSVLRKLRVKDRQSAIRLLQQRSGD